MKKLLNKKIDKGITLIALVITIVVLIILAGVIISITIGNGGIIDRAKLAKQEYSNATQYEEKEIAEYDNKIDEYSAFTRAGGSNINYTTDEQDTGLKWIDGKTIYQITLIESFKMSTSGEHDWTPPTGIDKLINVECNMSDGTGYEYYKNNNMYNFRFIKSSNKIRQWNTSSTSSTANVLEHYLTIQYTK